jgi:translation initiation factor IF-3
MSAGKINSGLPRSNHQIRVPQVRVIGADGAQIGVLQTYEALKMAKDQGFDLVEVNAKSFPPVCKIMDFGKFKYEQKKKEKEIARNQKVIETKQLSLRPTTDDHDLEVKANHIRRWIEEGNKVRIVVAFKGREITHPEIARQAVTKMLDILTPNSFVFEEKLQMSEKQLTALIAPSAATNAAIAAKSA